MSQPSQTRKKAQPLLTFLGILLDTTTMQASITAERKRDILQAIQEVQGKRTCKKRHLLSLIGKLAFACKVVTPGRIFLRRLIDLSTTVHALHHHITLTRDARADLAWWIHFLPTWSGSSLSSTPSGSHPQKWSCTRMPPTQATEPTGPEDGLMEHGSPANPPRHCMEGTLCCPGSLLHLGPSLGTATRTLPLR